MTERVTLTVDNHVGIIKFNRPDKMNALDQTQVDAILNVAEVVQNDANIRAVVLAGEGRAFCAGIDVTTLGSQVGTDDFAKMEPRTHGTHGIANRWQQIVWQWREMQVPVIAAVQGVAFGGGLQIMMGADIRIVAPDTKLSIMEVKWGLVPDMAGTQLFRHVVRDDVLRMLTYTHRIFSGEEALGYGFATELSQTPFEDALALAQEIASKSPSAVVLSKKLLNAAPYSDEVGSKNQLESIFAGMQKRPADFENYRA